jgi:hypothetical protein
VEFPVTRHELHALAEYCGRSASTTTSGSSSISKRAAANGGGAYTSTAASTDPTGSSARRAMDKAFVGAAACIRKLRNISDEEWKVFTEGTREEQDAWRESSP